MNKPIANLEIKKENIKPHADIEMEMSKFTGKWFMFELRCSGGSIVDFVIREFIDHEKLVKK